MVIEDIRSQTRTIPLTNNSDEQRYLFWDALADFSSSDMGDSALQFCMQTVASFIDARHAIWAGTVRVGHGKACQEDPYKGWRLGAWEVMGHTRDTCPEWMRVAARTFNSSGSRELKASHHILEKAGRFRVYALSKGVGDLDAYRQTETYDYFFRQQGVVDRLWIVTPINEDSESCFFFDRYEGQPEYDEREIEAAAGALRGIKWFHRQLLLFRGLGIAEESLTPSESGIVRELLTGASEKEIAVRLNLTPATTHQYIVRIFRKFGVHKRAEFMSMWLRGRG